MTYKESDVRPPDTTKAPTGSDSSCIRQLAMYFTLILGIALFIRSIALFRSFRGRKIGRKQYK